jgi:hypothetical protein
MEETKFRLGDQVRIVNYTHWRVDYDHETEKWSKTESHETVGQVGIVREAHKTQDIDNYAIEGIKGKVAWYNNDQLELVYRPLYEK